MIQVNRVTLEITVDTISLKVERVQGFLYVLSGTWLYGDGTPMLYGDGLTEITYGS